jgi:integrase
MAKKLTAISVQSHRPRAERYEVPDGNTGLRLVVQPSGHRSWCVRYRHGGRTRKLTLDGGLSLAAARAATAAALLAVEQGTDPAAEKRRAKAAAATTAANAAADTLRAVAMAYQTREGSKLRTARARLRLMERLVFPTLGDRPIGDIRRSEIVRLLDTIEDASGARSADLALGLLRRVMRWHQLRDDNFNSPVAPGMSRHGIREHARTRVLSDSELQRVWRAAGEASAFGALVRFLVLTAAPRAEAANLTWDEIDSVGNWHLPPSRNKTGEPLTRPLSRAARAVLDGVPRVVGCRYVFASDNGRAPTNFSWRKKALDAASGVSGWRLHDLRRTARSLLSRAGVSPDHAERCLGHVIPGVRGTYDRHQYQAEMLHAFEALAAVIDQIVNPPQGGNVVPLRA